MSNHHTLTTPHGLLFSSGAGEGATEYLNDDDVPLGTGLASQLPRRNHTISATTARLRKRLPQHFEQPLSPPSSSSASSNASQHQRLGTNTANNSKAIAAHMQQEIGSPNRNSLKEIAGLENEHDEWERAILDERSTAAEQLAALSTDESASISGRSSPLVSTANIRRHQSLNHHLGRSIGARLSGAPTASPTPSSLLQHTLGNSSRTPPSITSQLQAAFTAAGPTDVLMNAFSSGTAEESSPITPGSRSSNYPWAAPTSFEETNTGAASPSRYAHKFSASNPSLLGRSSTPSPDGTSHNPAASPNNYFDIHLALANLNLGGNQASSETYDTISSSNDPSSNGQFQQTSMKRLPSLVTNRDALARGARHTHQASEDLAGPASAAPYLSVSQRRVAPHLGHAKNQSSDAVLRSTLSHTSSTPLGPSALGMNDSILGGPHTAAPTAWGQKEALLGLRTGDRSGLSTSSTLGSAVTVGEGTEAAARRERVDFMRSRSMDQTEAPSQWGLGLSPVTERSNHNEQLTLALSIALAEQKEKTAVLEAALRASSGLPPIAVDESLHQQEYQRQPYVDYTNTNHLQTPRHQRVPSQKVQIGPDHPTSPPQQGRDPQLPQHFIPQSSFYVPGRGHQHHQPTNGDAGRFSFPLRASTGPIANPYSAAPPSFAQVIDESSSLAARLQLNPDNFELSPRPSARFLVIKSFTEDDVHRSIRHGIWASTDKGNQRLDRVYKECQEAARAEVDGDAEGGSVGQGNSEDVPPGHVYLFFSVNGSGHFCGMALMTSAVDFETSSSVWAQEGKWKGHFKVKHIFVKDIPNRELRHIKLENSVENKSVTQSRDTQELGRIQGVEMLKIFHGYPCRTSLLNDMDFYDEEERRKKAVVGGQGQRPQESMGGSGGVDLIPGRQGMQNTTASQGPYPGLQGASHQFPPSGPYPSPKPQHPLPMRPLLPQQHGEGTSNGDFTTMVPGTTGGNPRGGSGSPAPGSGGITSTSSTTVTPTLQSGAFPSSGGGAAGVSAGKGGFKRPPPAFTFPSPPTTTGLQQHPDHQQQFPSQTSPYQHQEHQQQQHPGPHPSPNAHTHPHAQPQRSLPGGASLTSHLTRGAATSARGGRGGAAAGAAAGGIRM